MLDKALKAFSFPIYVIFAYMHYFKWKLHVDFLHIAILNEVFLDETLCFY
jgi:hypothetical protein